VATTVTVNEVLDGQVVLDLQCLDRVYLNAYVPSLQVGGQVVSFLAAHLGYPIPSPVIKIGTAFRAAVARFADDEHIPVVRFGKGDRKIDAMRPYLRLVMPSYRAAFIWGRRPTWLFAAAHLTQRLSALASSATIASTSSTNQVAIVCSAPPANSLGQTRKRLRIPTELHRRLATEAAEQGISLNRLVSQRLAI
jgi:HicB family